MFHLRQTAFKRLQLKISAQLLKSQKKQLNFGVFGVWLSLIQFWRFSHNHYITYMIKASLCLFWYDLGTKNFGAPFIDRAPNRGHCGKAKFRWVGYQFKFFEKLILKKGIEFEF